jgi:hypothetical protein
VWVSCGEAGVARLPHVGTAARRLSRQAQRAVEAVKFPDGRGGYPHVRYSCGADVGHSTAWIVPSGSRSSVGA